MKRKEKSPRFSIKKRGRAKELFDVGKFKRSLENSGLSQSMCDELIGKVDAEKSCYHSTASLFRKTRDEIYRKSKKLAAHYSIKKSIFDLGPTGYPFEILCSEIFKAKGFKTKVSVVKKGEFIKHEVDVVAVRPDLTIFCECKFHNSRRKVNDVKLPLYIHSRFIDISHSSKEDKLQYAILTNTKFSLDAIKYSEGVGLLLFSLDYPDKSTFLDLMKKYKVYPVTILKNLKKVETAELIKNKVVVIKHLQSSHLEDMGFARDRISKVFNEVKELLM